MLTCIFFFFAFNQNWMLSEAQHLWLHSSRLLCLHDEFATERLDWHSILDGATFTYPTAATTPPSFWASCGEQSVKFVSHLVQRIWHGKSPFENVWFKTHEVVLPRFCESHQHFLLSVVCCNSPSPPPLAFLWASLRAAPAPWVWIALHPGLRHQRTRTADKRSGPNPPLSPGQQPQSLLSKPSAYHDWVSGWSSLWRME